MTKRRWFLGSLVAVALAGIGTVTAFAHGGHGGRQWMMKRMVSAAIDEALDAAKVTPEQRARIHAARDRAMTEVTAHAGDRRGRFDEVLATFESDRLDPAKLQAMRAKHEEEHRRVADAIQAAVIETHDTLTPEQRRAVADWIRSHRFGHMH
jgi:Spy/CpxP family protein refolding chaperone